jgi:hypothetical protein
MLQNDYQLSGRYRRIFDAGLLPSGIYLCRLRSSTHTTQRTMILAR